MDFKPVVLEKVDEIEAAFYFRACDVFHRRLFGAQCKPPQPCTEPGRLVILPSASQGAVGSGGASRRTTNEATSSAWVVTPLFEAEDKGHHLEERRRHAEERRSTSSACSASPRAWVSALNPRRKWAYNEIKLVGQLRRDLRPQPGKDTELKFEPASTICGPRAA